MRDPTRSIRAWVRSPVEAIRWACVLEATSPKAGNVFPGKAFDDLRYQDFVRAAEIASIAFADLQAPVSSRMLTAVRAVDAAVGSNVNLGILLLLVPLVAADESLGSPVGGVDGISRWRVAIAKSLERLDGDDGRRVFQGIAESSAGGMGRVPEMDIHDAGDHPIDLLEAMRHASARDRIARQYAGDFTDLLDRVLPMVSESISNCGDMLEGIAVAHVRILAEEPDSLIARKNGHAAAVEIQQLATSIDPYDAAAVAEFDRRLRQNGHTLNPGTTADLIAASLYLMLRTRPPAP